jgi:thioredoxin reductase
MVVGGGDSAVEAAVALARQPGNIVSISYRREVFVRLKEKNEKNVTNMMHSGSIKAFMSSNVAEIKPSEVLLQTADQSLKKLENDFVFIFAGGDPPTELPKKAGIQFRTS